MKIKVKYHDNEIPKIKKIQQGDLIDLYAAETVKLKQGDFKLISLGVIIILFFPLTLNTTYILTVLKFVILGVRIVAQRK